MTFVGIDLSGVNSLACIRSTSNIDTFHHSAYPDRPSVVLFPLVRKEKVLAGDAALKSGRGLGLPWPPLASAEEDGWSSHALPMSNGRILVSYVWERLCCKEPWSEGEWPPAPDMPKVTKPSPDLCLAAEVIAVVQRATIDAGSKTLVLAIPNRLPEESQDAILDRLGPDARLLWRSMAAAMAWGESNTSAITPDTRLAIIDVGFRGVELTLCEFRSQTVDAETYNVPVRRLRQLHFVETESLIPDHPAPFLKVNADLKPLEDQLGALSQFCESATHAVICGPLARTAVYRLQSALRRLVWSDVDSELIARGAALFAFRLSRHLPSYVDVLPSLELFTLTELHEPKWLTLIPNECEVSGGQEYLYELKKPIFIERGTTRLASWLQRAGESEFRKLTTTLPAQTTTDAWVDLHVSARPAGGFARVQIVPSRGEVDVLGRGQNVLLNWQSMERVARSPEEHWPKNLVKFGWPACGVLYGYRRFAREFLSEASGLEAVLLRRDADRRLQGLERLKEIARQTIPPQMAGARREAGHAAPVNQLVCFGTDDSSMFPTYEGSSANFPEAFEIANVLWERLKVLVPKASAKDEITTLIFILGRMGGFSPSAFQDYLADDLSPSSSLHRLYAAGRVLRTSLHGAKLFSVLNAKRVQGDALNNNWLRMIVYVTYQQEEVMREVPRTHVLSAFELCLDSFEKQVRRGNARGLFMNGLRALVLLLRSRRYRECRNLLCDGVCPPSEQALYERFKKSLEAAEKLRLSSSTRMLVERTQEWLDFRSATDEMPPISPPGEAESEVAEDG